MQKNKELSSKIFDAFNIIGMCVIIFITLYPIIYELAISMSSSKYVQANMVTFLPKGINMGAYKKVFADRGFWISYKNTIFYTVFGTFINIFFTCTLAFCLSRKELIGRKPITFLVMMTMFFSGGIIPNFLVVKWLGLYNTIWAVVLPYAINTYNMVIVRTFMVSIPESLVEAVRIDGGNDWNLYSRVILPLSKPVIATVGLFYAVNHWNSYFTPMLYLNEKSLQPLQVILKEMVVDQNLQSVAADLADMEQSTPNSDMLIAASIIISLLPIISVYPFLQKYFVKGMMIGSVKG